LSFLDFVLFLFLLFKLGICLVLYLFLPVLFFGKDLLNLFLVFFCTLRTSGRGAKPIGRLRWFFRRRLSCFSAWVNVWIS
jgi:hypothetical protein